MEMKRPDPRVRLSWMLYTVVAALIPAALSLLLFRVSFIPDWIVNLFTALWALLLTLAVTVYFPLRYHRARYGVSDTHIEAVRGVYFISHCRMPMSAVRHITLVRGPLEYLFGLSFVIVSGAGGWLLLEGIPYEEAYALQQRLMNG